MIELKIGASSRALISSGLLDRAGDLIDVNLGHRCAIICDTNVEPLFAERVRRSLESNGFQPTTITVAPGEKSKTLEQVGSICDQMISARLDRESFVVGLGGGVIGDISGFVAAIFHRGIPHVQIPTTLLAMVDSSIGGKTGVNTRDGKNLIGAMHQPALVIDDVDLLKSLPSREFNQGFAEVIKHAIIADAEMFAEVAQASGLRNNKIASETLAPLIARNIEVKMKFVVSDQNDRTGERALLNFGHTIGHAIERAGDYQRLLHGEAISLGMIAASAISSRKFGLPENQQSAIVDLLKAYQLPTKLPADFPRAKILEALPFDKKFVNGKIHFVITSKIGSAFVTDDVTLEDIREAMDEL